MSLVDDIVEAGEGQSGEPAGIEDQGSGQILNEKEKGGIEREIGKKKIGTEYRGNIGKFNQLK